MTWLKFPRVSQSKLKPDDIGQELENGIIPRILSAKPALKAPTRPRTVPTLVENDGLARFITGDSCSSAIWDSITDIMKTHSGFYKPHRRTLLLTSPPWGVLRKTGNSASNDKSLTEQQVDQLARLADQKTPKATIWLVHMPWGLHHMWVRILQANKWEAVDNPLVFVRPGGWVKAQWQSDSVFREFRSNVDFLWIFKKKGHRSTRTFEEAKRQLGITTKGVMGLTVSGHALPKNKVLPMCICLSALTRYDSPGWP